MFVFFFVDLDPVELCDFVVVFLPDEPGVGLCSASQCLSAVVELGVFCAEYPVDTLQD